MKEVKIQIPDNCELVKDGDSYVVREKKQNPPRSWEEFCERYPLKDDCFIRNNSTIESAKALGIVGNYRYVIEDVNWITSKKEAEAFLALMQLRQLRKAWVGDWKPVEDSVYWGVYKTITMGVIVDSFSVWNPALTFPTEEMAEDLLSCFRDLCETAKILL